jgi:hypothetical protein
VLEHARQRVEQGDRVRDQVAEVAQTGAVETLLVLAVDLGQRLESSRPGGLREQGELVVADPVLLEQGDERQGVLREAVRPEDAVQRAQAGAVQLLQRAPHRHPLLEAAHQQPAGVGPVVAEQAGAEAVERADPRLVVRVVEALVEPLLDLAGRGGREREHEDLTATGVPALDQARVQVDQRLRLAGAGTGE